MKLPKSKYGKLIDALDGIRADNRDGRYDKDIQPHSIEDDLLLYIERKGYCKYEINNLRFIRVLTEKGLDVLGSQDYSKYRKNKNWDKRKSNIPLVVSIIAVIFTGISNFKSCQKTDTEKRLERLEKVQDSMYIQANLPIPNTIPKTIPCVLRDSLTKHK